MSEMVWKWNPIGLYWEHVGPSGVIMRAKKTRQGAWIAEAEDSGRVHKSGRVHHLADFAQEECFALRAELAKWRAQP